MFLGEALKFSVQALRANPVRSLLTGLGMVIGTASVILVVTISLTSQNYILEQIEGVGSNMIFASYEVGTQQSNAEITADFIKSSDVRAIREQLASRIVAATGIESNYDLMFMGVSAFWLILAVTYFFADGGFAIVGPYAPEVWPSHLRTSGMGSAYGFGGIGKIIGPVGLALIVGSNNYLKPDVPLPEIPLAFVYLGCWFLMAGFVYYFFGPETRGKSIEQIDRDLAATADLRAVRVRQA